MKDGRLHLRLTQETVQELKGVARRKGVTVSYLVELALEELLVRARRETSQHEDIPQL